MVSPELMVSLELYRRGTGRCDGVIWTPTPINRKVPLKARFVAVPGQVSGLGQFRKTRLRCVRERRTGHVRGRTVQLAVDEQVRGHHA